MHTASISLGVKQPGVTLITHPQSGAEVKERVETSTPPTSLHALLRVEVYLYVNIDITHRSVLSRQWKVRACSCEVCV